MATREQIRQLYQESEFEVTNNPSVDMVLAYISYNQRHGKRVKSMSLRHDMYYMFKAHVETKVEVSEDQVEFEVDGTIIRLSELDISSPFIADIL